MKLISGKIETDSKACFNISQHLHGLWQRNDNSYQHSITQRNYGINKVEVPSLGN